MEHSRGLVLVSGTSGSLRRSRPHEPSRLRTPTREKSRAVHRLPVHQVGKPRVSGCVGVSRPWNPKRQKPFISSSTSFLRTDARIATTIERGFQEKLYFVASKSRWSVTSRSTEASTCTHDAADIPGSSSVKRWPPWCAPRRCLRCSQCGFSRIRAGCRRGDWRVVGARPRDRSCGRGAGGSRRLLRVIRAVSRRRQHAGDGAQRRSTTCGEVTHVGNLLAAGPLERGWWWSRLVCGRHDRAVAGSSLRPTASCG
jgi:hypothetical protein